MPSDIYKLHIGQILRYPKVHDTAAVYIDECLNFKHLVHLEGKPSLMLERGINTPSVVVGPDKAPRRPAILIASSPHKKGSKETPWQDFFDVDNGHIRYFGDNKHPGKSPEDALGNKALKAAFQSAHHHDSIERAASPPLLFFKRVTHNGRQKGFPQFQGFGIVRNVELVTQWDNAKQRSFTNYAFDFTVFSQAEENEIFDFRWIADRRNPDLTLEDALRHAPQAWRVWVRHGANSLETVRRRVSKLMVVKREAQQPLPGSESHKVLRQIYEFFSDRRHHFEALAEIVAERVFGQELGIYQKGWITSAGGDGGADFVAKLTLGSGFAKTGLIVLGQAKCERLNAPTGGNHIARTVARLRRGWIGVYVTTSYFSSAVQQEVIEDRYPIVLIHGKRVAEEVISMLHETDNYSSFIELLEAVSSSYSERIRSRDPEEVLSL